jgi:hypothetical protein
VSNYHCIPQSKLRQSKLKDYVQANIRGSVELMSTSFCLQYKLCKVKRVQTGPKGIPFLVTHDGRTIRYPDPIIKVHDTIQLEIATTKIMDSIRFDPGKTQLSLKLFSSLAFIEDWVDLCRLGSKWAKINYPAKGRQL